MRPHWENPDTLAHLLPTPMAHAAPVQARSEVHFHLSVCFADMLGVRTMWCPWQGCLVQTLRGTLQPTRSGGFQPKPHSSGPFVQTAGARMGCRRQRSSPSTTLRLHECAGLHATRAVDQKLTRARAHPTGILYRIQCPGKNQNSNGRAATHNDITSMSVMAPGALPSPATDADS